MPFGKHTILPDLSKGLKLPKPKLERGGNPFKLEVKREGGRLVIRTDKADR